MRKPGHPRFSRSRSRTSFGDSHAILYRGAGFDVAWPQFAAVAGIGALFFALGLLRFRSVTRL